MAVRPLSQSRRHLRQSLTRIFRRLRGRTLMRLPCPRRLCRPVAVLAAVVATLVSRPRRRQCLLRQSIQTRRIILAEANQPPSHYGRLQTDRENIDVVSLSFLNLDFRQWMVMVFQLQD